MLTFEQARREDIPHIFQLNRELIDRYEDFSTLDRDYVLQWVRKNLERQLPRFRRILWGGQHAGFFCLTEAGGQWELDSLFVFPEFRGRGIGTAVLQYCLEASRGKLFLYVFKENSGALRLYERLGFQIRQEARKTAYIMDFKKQG